MRAALLLLLAACTGAPEAPEADTDVFDPLEREAYAFCHEPGVDAERARQYCDLLRDAPPDVCPGMRASCDDPTLESLPSGGCDGQGGGGDGVAAAPREPWRPGDPPDLGCDMPDLSFSAVFLQWLVAGAVAVLILLVLRSVYAWWSLRQPRSYASAPLAPVPAPIIEGDDDLPALPEDELLAFAQAALAAGRIGEAVLYARGAALRRLARRGLLRLHKARTDREYLQGVRHESATHGALREVLTAVEDLRWAGRTPDRSQAAAAVDAAGRILAALLLAALLAPAAQAQRFGPDGDAAIAELLREEGYDVQWASAQLADLEAGEVDIVLLDLSRVEPKDEDWTGLLAWVEAGGLLIVAGEHGSQLDQLGPRLWSEDGRDLLATDLELRLDTPRWPQRLRLRYCQPWLMPVVWVEGETVEALAANAPPEPLVEGEAAPDPDAAPLGELSEDEGDEVPRGELTPEEEADAAPRREPAFEPPEEAEDPAALPDTTDETPSERRKRRARRVREERRAEVDELLRELREVPAGEGCDPAVVARVTYHEGVIVGIADPGLLRNASLVSPENRAFLAGLPRRGAEAGWWELPEKPRVLMALVGAESSDWSPPQVMANLRLLPFVLHLLAAWLILALWRGWTFAAPRDPPQESRRAFAEHAAALGHQWRVAGGERFAASAFARMWLQRLEVRGVVAAAVRRGWTLERARLLADDVARLASDPDGPERGDERTIVEDLWNVTRQAGR